MARGGTHVPSDLGGWALRLGTVLVLALIAAYRAAIGPLLVGGCRYTPSCSRYAEEAIVRHGLRRGGVLALKRLLRCQPFHHPANGGWDPVPERLEG